MVSWSPLQWKDWMGSLVETSWTKLCADWNCLPQRMMPVHQPPWWEESLARSDWRSCHWTDSGMGIGEGREIGSSALSSQTPVHVAPARPLTEWRVLASAGSLSIPPWFREEKGYSRTTLGTVYKNNVQYYLSLSISSSSLANLFLSSSLRELPTIFWSDGFVELSPWNVRPSTLITFIVNPTHLPQCFQIGLSAVSALKLLSAREMSVIEFHVESLSTSQLAQWWSPQGT